MSSDTIEVKKNQIIKSLNNLHLKGTIDESLQKNSGQLFGSTNEGPIKILEVGLYQIIDSMIHQLLKIKNNDNITRRVGENIQTQYYYNTSLNRYGIKNRENQLYKLLKEAPVILNNGVEYLDLSNNLDGSLSVKHLECKLYYNEDFKIDTDNTASFSTITGDESIDFLNKNLQNNNFISLQTPLTYDDNKNRISGEKKFVLRRVLTQSIGDDGDANTDGTYYTNTEDNCIEFKAGYDDGSDLTTDFSDITATNLTSAINSTNILSAELNTTLKVIKITQNNTNGIILPNISFMKIGLLLPIDNFKSTRYNQYIANVVSKSITNRGCELLNNTRLSVLFNAYDNTANITKYSEDALFEFFSRMNYDFIKLNNNHIGKEKNPPGYYNINNVNNLISQHHLNSVQYYIDITNSNINQNHIKKNDAIKQLFNIKKTGNFGSIDIDIDNSKTLYDKYKYFDVDLFSSNQVSTEQNIPYLDNDPNSIGLYQIINDLINQLIILKKTIEKREIYYLNLLKNTEAELVNNEEIYHLDTSKVNNYKSKTIFCQEQGGLLSADYKPSFIEIINSTNYNPGIEFKYSQDALYELCGRWLNELLKLNNSHGGYEDILPGFYGTDSNRTIVNHHLNAITEQ
jgi:hypothetical protein